MRIIATVKVDQGSIGEATATLDCNKIEQDPLFPDRVILHLNKPLTLKHLGQPSPTRRWSVGKSDICDWYEVDQAELDRLVKQANLASQALRHKPPVEVASVKPEPAEAKPEPASKPERIEVDEPERRPIVVNVTNSPGLNLSLDLDDDEEDEQ